MAICVVSLAVVLWLTFVQLAATQSVPLRRVPRQQTAPTPNLYSTNVSISDAHGFAYLAEVDIGNQEFLVLLDTGSSDLWVVSSNCTQKDCRDVPSYKPTSTLNLSPTEFELQYLLGAVSGVIGTETVAVGPFEIMSQAFALANETSGLGLSQTGNSGILGLSFPLEASIPDTSGTTLLENLLSPFDETDRFFAVRLGRDLNDSSFTVGAIDPAFANSTTDFSYTHVYPAARDVYDYWKIPIQSMTINGTSFALSRSRVHGAPSPLAVFDTGTTLILGPTADVDRLWASVGGAQKTDAGWQVRCDRAMVIGLVLGAGDSAQEYAVDPADLSWLDGGRDGNWCMGGIQGNDQVSSGDWLLGDTFLRNVYVVHHVGNSTQPPMLGLLGMTDRQAALKNFRAERGNDVTPPVQVISSPTSHSSGIGAGAICGISSAGGFVFGAVLTVAISACLSRRSSKY